MPTKTNKKLAKHLTDHPCPFCACGNTHRVRLGSYEVYWIECGQCHARGPEKPDLAEAIKAWNIKETSGWIKMAAPE